MNDLVLWQIDQLGLIGLCYLWFLSESKQIFFLFFIAGEQAANFILYTADIDS